MILFCSSNECVVLCTCHLLGSNSSLFRNATSSEELHSRLAGLKMEVTSRTSEISTQNQLLIVKTTTVVSQTTNNTTANGEVETSQTNETQQINNEWNCGWREKWNGCAFWSRSFICCSLRVRGSSSVVRFRSALGTLTPVYIESRRVSLPVMKLSRVLRTEARIRLYGYDYKNATRLI